MTWQTRLKEPAYVSPSGARMVFIYEDVSYSYEKKGAAYDFPDADGTYVQSLGKTGRRYPLSVIFAGPNCDLQANIFTAMLDEDGEGRLEHPVYGAINVVPLGEITRKDPVKTAGNQVIIDVTFWETTGVVYPTSQGSAVDEVRAAIAEYNAAVAAQFADSVETESPSAFAALYADYSAMLAAARRALTRATEASAAIQRRFNAINQSIVTDLDTLIRDPLVLATQTSLLLQTPSFAVQTPIGSRLSAYQDLLTVLTATVESPGYGSRNSNRFKARDVYTTGAVGGQINSVLEAQFSTKPEALAAADYILSALDTVTQWRDSNFVALGEPDPGGAYAALQNAAAIAAGYLVEISFTLLQERVIYLDRPRALVDLVAELYGKVDSKLDFFIASNDLTGSEILELPRGRRVVYYV